MIAILTSLVGPKLAKPVLYALIALLAVAVLSVGYCSLNNRAAQQAKQTTRSSEAIADAAEQAVGVVINSNARDTSVDAVVTQAAKDIDNAPDDATRRAAALAAVCSLPEYSRDSRCKQ